MNARDKLFDTVAHSMATSEEFPEQEARRLIDAVVAEVRAEAADFLSEIGTPITGERTEHERGVMYASERLRAMATPASAPVESAGDETGEAPSARESARSGLVSDLVESCGLNEVYEDDVLAFLAKYDAKHRADVLAEVVS